MSKVICLWASPRNISTALMYSFAQRNDVKVLDEPFYAHYLKNINPDIDHPGKKEILDNQSTDLKIVVKEIDVLKQQYGCVFIKNMTHHLRGADFSFAEKWYNIILTRDPQKAIISFSKVIPNPTMDDLGYKLQYDLASFFTSKKMNFKVISSENLLKNPKEVLSDVCEFSKMKFNSQMLSWRKGGIVEDGVWAKYWYKNVHNSDGFSPWVNKPSEEINANQFELLEQATHYYQQLISFL
tara:strand:- start:2035 stop:2754 length:720 start_codon:yes stop_codon:yes gene_type:complete